MRQGNLEAAVPAGADPRRYARVLAQVHDATLSGIRGPVRPRPVIEASWRRMFARGIDPEHGRAGDVLVPEELEARRRGSALSEVLPVLRSSLTSLADQAAHIMVVTDAVGTVLWRDGSNSVRRHADNLGFVEGMNWNEDVVGTNAIGTALVTGQPVQVYSAEHYVRSHHTWTCACAPIRDPRSARLLGAVDLSGPAATVNATTLALVDAAARLAESHLRAGHVAELERLRATAAPLLAKIDGPALVTDWDGWVAAATGTAPPERVVLPAECTAGRVRLPALGDCQCEPIAGGWLMRILSPDRGEAEVRSDVLLDLRGPQARLDVTTPSSTWSQRLTPRHAQLLSLLARHQDGRTAAQLAGDVFADPARTVTVRAEMSRLRRNLGGLLDHRPYRFCGGVHVEVAAP